MELVLKTVIGAGVINVPFSSTMSASSCFVSVTFSVADTVGPLVSPARCKKSSAGMQVLKGTAGDEVEPILAMIPARPGILAVAKPLVSTETTVLSEDVQVKLPTEPVMSWPLCLAVGVN
jgi:hypothetical protein